MSGVFVEFWSLPRTISRPLTGFTPFRTSSSEPFRARRLPQENQRPGDSNGPLSPDSPRCTWRLFVLYVFCWMIALARYEPGAAEATDWMKPPSWAGNYWGPAATRARSAGHLPPLQSNPEMARWHGWGREVLRQGDIVFRLGDARVVRGIVPLSRFIARATGSPFSHTGVVAIEDGSPVVYDCSSAGVQRQPFEIWMLDSLGAPAVKRLKPAVRERIAGVIDFCRAAFERQILSTPASAWRMTRCTVWSSPRRRSGRRALHFPSLSGLATGSVWRAFSDRLADPACKRFNARSPDHTRAACLHPR